MKTNFTTLSTFAGAILLCSAPLTKAIFIQNSTGIASPAITITFDEHVLASNTPLTTQYSDLGVTFENLFYDTQFLNFSNTDSPVAENFQPITNPFSVHFLQTQTSAALALITNPGEVTQFGAYLSGILVDSGSASTGLFDPNNFFGFTGVSFDEIRMSVSNNVNGAAAIDRIQVGTSSVPDGGSTIALLGLALGGIGAVRRKLNLA